MHKTGGTVKYFCVMSLKNKYFSFLLYLPLLKIKFCFCRLYLQSSDRHRAVKYLSSGTTAFRTVMFVMLGILVLLLTMFCHIFRLIKIVSYLMLWKEYLYQYINKEFIFFSFSLQGSCSKSSASISPYPTLWLLLQ